MLNYFGKCIPHTFLFLRFKSLFFIQKVNFVSIYFCGCYFCGYELRVHTFVGSAVRGYNQYKEIWEASYGEIKEKITPFAVSVIKDKEIVHILIVPSSHSKL